MNAQTRVSAKGQIVIPKEIRTRHQMSPGRVLDVIDTPDGVLLRPAAKKEGISKEEALERIRKVVRYDGPPVTIEEMNETIEQMWAQGGPKDW
jgi:AbrB family looped-hinge helix DNA binding protein